MHSICYLPVNFLELSVSCSSVLLLWNCIICHVNFQSSVYSLLNIWSNIVYISFHRTTHSFMYSRFYICHIHSRFTFLECSFKKTVPLFSASHRIVFYIKKQLVINCKSICRFFLINHWSSKSNHHHFSFILCSAQLFDNCFIVSIVDSSLFA